jgi:WD40 repeat protein
MKPEDISEGGEDGPTGGLPWVVSMAWSADGNTLFVGSTNGNVYVYETALH